MCVCVCTYINRSENVQLTDRRRTPRGPRSFRASGRERLPSLLGDGGDRAPNHDLKEEKTRLKGQAEEEQEEAGSGREAAHLSGVTAAGRALSGRQVGG